jgi:hypothetical protein
MMANDVFSSYQNGAAGLPQNVGNRYADFDARNKLNLLLALSDSNTMKVVNALVAPVLSRKEEELPFTPDLEQATVDVYEANIRIIRTLERGYGFTTLFYWQPTLYSKKTLSENERTLSRREAYGSMLINVTARLNTAMIHDLSHIFDAEATTIFIDDLHTSEAGNALIAARMAADLKPLLAQKTHR